MPEFLRVVQGKLIVSCQAREGDAFQGPENMVRFARAAVEGGAAAIRANGPADVRAIRQAVSVPVLGIEKRPLDDGQILITPSFADAAALVEAGAAAVALDCTARGQRYGALERLRRIKAELGVPVAADIATLEEALAAAHAGADAVLSTMRGYTAETARVTAFEPVFIKQLVSSVELPVIAEGRIWTLEQARAALENGAHAVVVGTAITRPHETTAHFASALAEGPAASFTTTSASTWAGPTSSSAWSPARASSASRALCRRPPSRVPGLCWSVSRRSRASAWSGPKAWRFARPAWLRAAG